MPNNGLAQPFVVSVAARAAALPWTEDFELEEGETSLFTLGLDAQRCIQRLSLSVDVQSRGLGYVLGVPSPRHRERRVSGRLVDLAGCGPLLAPRCHGHVAGTGSVDFCDERPPLVDLNDQSGSIRRWFCGGRRRTGRPVGRRVGVVQKPTICRHGPGVRRPIWRGGTKGRWPMTGTSMTSRWGRSRQI